MFDILLLLIVGALIGCSGDTLTKVICDVMNRDIFSVITGSFGTKKQVKAKEYNMKES